MGVSAPQGQGLTGLLPLHAQALPKAQKRPRRRMRKRRKKGQLWGPRTVIRRAKRKEKPKRLGSRGEGG